MPQNRITSHPILEVPKAQTIEFFWKGAPLQAKEGETIASALIANGIDIFGHHPKDNSPLGLFCANGQCSQCLVLVEGKPVKSCMTKVKHGMSVMPADGLPDISHLQEFEDEHRGGDYKKIIDVPVLIIGGGPAGLSAAIELGQLGIHTLLVDDKSHLGGKLVLQTHRFFGSSEVVYAGTRGIDIAKIFESKIRVLPSVDIWLETTAIGVYEEKIVGLWRREDDQYVLIKPEVLLIASGARERSLPFKGNTLPGIYGAGAFQTLANRDLVKPAKNLFVVGGGNVGLIASYHALQAGINVVGLAEALPECSGYKVHKDKLARLNVPILTSHTILEAKGVQHVQGVVIAKVDENIQPIPGTGTEIACDCILIAVGLDPVDEFYHKALDIGLPAYAAGDAYEISEASAAMFSGKIKGIEIAHHLGYPVSEIPEKWRNIEAVLKSKPGPIHQIEEQKLPGEVFPVIHCHQEIPCDPCASVCPYSLIRLNTDDIRSLPQYCPIDEKICIGCERCVAVCPGLAITLVDFRKDSHNPIVSIPLEFNNSLTNKGDRVPVTDEDGRILGRYQVMSTRTLRQYPRTLIVRVQVPREISTKVAGIQIMAGWRSTEPEISKFIEKTQHETIICRCEHITSGEIRALIRSGVRDINQIKAVTRATMGACGGKTCLSLIKQIFKEEGIPLGEVTDTVQRPVFVEIPLETLAKNQQENA
ncbi:MAG: FAD-dependent oxidoreductase [Chloroflexota bacterium]|nr:FAD-dependent oxidoreductase [Chloroflexota bacterium]